MPSSYTGGQSTSNVSFNAGLMRTNDVPHKTYTDEGTFNLIHETAIEVDNEEELESDDDPIRQFGPDGTEIALFSKPKVVPIELEGSDLDSEGPDDAGGTKPNFTVYEPSPKMLNINIDAQDGLEFSVLPHRRSDHATNFSVLQVGIEFSSKDVVAELKRYSIKHRGNFHVTKP